MSPQRSLLPPIAVPLDIITQQRDAAAATMLCVSLSGLLGKQIADKLNIDAGQWSKIERTAKFGDEGDAHQKANFPLHKLNALMDICRNEAPLLYLLHSRGYDLNSLRKRETELETRLRLETERADQAESQLRSVLALFKGPA